MDDPGSLRLVMSNPAQHMTDPETETLGARIERLRVQAGYASQAALARQLGMNQMTVHRHIKRGVEPREETLAAYARALHVSVHYLVHGRDEERVPPAVESYLSGRKGFDVHPSVAARLRRIPWSCLTAGVVDEKDVHAVRVLIDGNLARRAPSTDGQHGGPISASRSDLSHESRAKHEPRRRAEPARG